MKKLYVYFEIYIEKIFIEFKNNNKIVLNIEELSEDTLLWKGIFKKICQINVSEKSLNNLQKRIIHLKKYNKKCIYVNIQKNINIKIINKTNLLVEINIIY
jgi:hypothetical protein